MASGKITMTFDWSSNPQSLKVVHHRLGDSPHVVIESGDPHTFNTDWEAVVLLLQKHLKLMLDTIRPEIGG